MVQVAIDKVIDVIAVRHRLVPAAGAMSVVVCVLAAVVLRRAAGRIGCVHSQRMLLNAVRRMMVEMAVVQVIDVAIVLDARVPATRAVLMVMIAV